MLTSWLDLQDIVESGAGTKVQRELWSANCGLAKTQCDVARLLQTLPPKQQKECRSMLKSTHEVREFLRATLVGMQDGRYSTSMARTRILLARAVIDTVKVELVAANLGREVHVVTFDTGEAILRAAE